VVGVHICEESESIVKIPKVRMTPNSGGLKEEGVWHMSYPIITCIIRGHLATFQLFNQKEGKLSRLVQNFV
jgi:hypothetical protein